MNFVTEHGVEVQLIKFHLIKHSLRLWSIKLANLVCINIDNFGLTVVVPEILEVQMIL